MKQLSHAIQLLPTDSIEEIKHKASLVKPSLNQLKWNEYAYCAFVHFGINTFTNQEWGDGLEDPRIFNPYAFDADEMVSIFKKAGMKMVILTCKHHDGFCLWPSQYTNHSVKMSPYKNGKGDIVGEVAKACHEQNMAFGIYLSPWDRHERTYGKGKEYNDFYIAQLEELLTIYAPIADVWLDGACGEGTNGKKQIYDWSRIYRTVRTLAPNATISGVAPDVRWCGNEAGKCRESEWNVIPIPGCDAYLPEDSDITAKAVVNHNILPPYMCTNEDLGSISKLQEHSQNSDYLFWYPAQVDVSIRPGWFYHEYEDMNVKTVEELLNIYLNSVGGNTQLLLNIPPMPNGQLNSIDVSRLETLAMILNETFRVNFVNRLICQTENLIDIHLENPRTIDLIELKEDIKQGQQIEQFEIYDLDTHETIYQGTTIGSRKYIRIKPRSVQHLQLKITESRNTPHINFVGIYQMPLLLSEPKIIQDKKGQISLETTYPSTIYYTINDGNEEVYKKPFTLDFGGILKARCEYPKELIKKGIMTSNMEVGRVFGVNQSDWKIIKTSGKEETHPLALLDTDKNNYLKVKGNQYEIMLDMNKEYLVNGFLYQPVEDGYDFMYNCSCCEIGLSLDGISWEVLPEIHFDNVEHLPQLMVTYFEKEYHARYLKFKVTKSLRHDYVTLSNINVLAKGRK